jgi:hypothetical protein
MRFDVDSIYNRQNERIYAFSRNEVDQKDDTHRKTKFPTGVIVWLGSCDQDVRQPMIIKNGITKMVRSYIQTKNYNYGIKIICSILGRKVGGHQIIQILTLCTIAYEMNFVIRRQANVNSSNQTMRDEFIRWYNMKEIIFFEINIFDFVELKLLCMLVYK